MANPTNFVFSYKELAALLVREAGLTEGIWGLQVRFGMQATNFGPTDAELHPAAILAILEIGLQRFEKENNLSVNAAQVAKNGAAKKNRKKA